MSMFGLGMSYRDITAHIAEIYALDISSAMISSVTDKIIPMIKTWQQRPLESLYPFVWLDAIHYKMNENGRYESRAVYTILGLNMEGKKEILGLYISETKGAFSNENSLLKLLYMGIQNATKKKWTMPIQNWNLTLSQLSIYFEGRLDDDLDL